MEYELNSACCSVKPVTIKQLFVHMKFSVLCRFHLKLSSYPCSGAAELRLMVGLHFGTAKKAR